MPLGDEYPIEWGGLKKSSLSHLFKKMKGNHPLQPTWLVLLCACGLQDPLGRLHIRNSGHDRDFPVVGIRSKAWPTSLSGRSQFDQILYATDFQTWISSSLDRSHLQTQQVSCKARTSLWWMDGLVSILTPSLSRYASQSGSGRPAHYRPTLWWELSGIHRIWCQWTLRRLKKGQDWIRTNRHTLFLEVKLNKFNIKGCWVWFIWGYGSDESMGKK